MPLIELVDIRQKFRRTHILKDINLTIESGEVMALIGPTGAGKTTLLRLIDLLDVPVEGRIYFDGVDVSSSSEQRLQARRRMSLVQQKPIVFDMNVYENVAVGLKWRGEKKDRVRQRVWQVLEMVSMTDYARRDARTLSGGETQRIAIARALVTEPELLILDEPTANLDPVSTSKIEKLLTRIAQDRSITMLMSTHDMAQGQLLAQRIGVVMDGELVQVGQRGDIFRRPQSLEVAGFVGMDNMIRGRITSSEEGSVIIDMGGGQIESISDYGTGEEVRVGIRPEDITLSFDRISTSARNVFSGQIKSVSFAMPFATVELDCGFPLQVLITVRSAREMQLEVGKQIYASFKATAVHVVKV